MKSERVEKNAAGGRKGKKGILRQGGEGEDQKQSSNKSEKFQGIAVIN